MSKRNSLAQCPMPNAQCPWSLSLSFGPLFSHPPFPFSLIVHHLTSPYLPYPALPSFFALSLGQMSVPYRNHALHDTNMTERSEQCRVRTRLDTPYSLFFFLFVMFSHHSLYSTPPSFTISFSASSFSSLHFVNANNHHYWALIPHSTLQ